MTRIGFVTSLVAALLVFSFIVASCGGGGGTAVNPPGGNSGPSQTTNPPDGSNQGPGWTDIQDNGGFVPDPTGVPQYDGRPSPTSPPTGGGQVPGAESVIEDYGSSIVVLPQNSSGQGTIVLKNFQPGQKFVAITTNLDRNYLDFTTGSLTQGLPFTLPDAHYNFSADNLQKVTASAGAQGKELAKLEKFDISSEPYSGLEITPGEKLEPGVLGQREVEYALKTGFLKANMDAIRKPSALSKGIVRTFTAVDATVPMPPIEDPDSQEDTGNQFQWPWLYQYQDGRLVGIGAHCYVFLSTEINNGYPDGVKFTPERIQRLVQEFDSRIFPTTTSAFGPVRTYNEETVYYAPDRNLRITPDDFDDQGNLTLDIQAIRDDLIEQDQRIMITILNGVSPGGGGFYLSPMDRPATEPDENSPYQTAPEINHSAFSTIYLDPSNFPSNSDDWSGAYSVIAHEFQHKLHADNVVSNSTWFNEGLSMLAIHVNGYSVDKGNVIDFLVSQLESFMANPEQHAMFNDVSSDQQQGILYAPWYLFMLYVMEHYGPGTIRQFYTDSGGVIQKLERATGEPAKYIFQKWILANYIDGLDVPLRFEGETMEAYVQRVPLADPRFRYATFDMKGRVGNSSNVLPGVAVHRFPKTEEFYPIRSAARLVKPWCADYVVFENGTGGDLRITVDADANFRTFILPINYNQVDSSISIDTSVFIP